MHCTHKPPSFFAHFLANFARKIEKRPIVSTAIRHISLLCFISLFTVAASAATFTVTKTADTNDGVCDADCSLREAVFAANSATTDDIVEFSSETFSSVQTIALDLGDITLANNGSLVINGTGAKLLKLDGLNQKRIFSVNTGAVVTINRVRLSRGKGQGVNTQGGGSAIRNDGGTIVLSEIEISDNGANGNISVGHGGGIYNAGTLWIQNSSLLRNRSWISASESNGGAIYNAAGAIMRAENSRFEENQSLSPDSGSGGQGGGIYSQNGTVTTIIACEFINNRGKGGGGIWIEDGELSITSSNFSGNVAISANSGGGVFHGAGDLSVSGSAFNNNSAPSGGGIAAGGDTASILASTFTNNFATAGNGGGLANGAITIVQGSIFTGNSAASGGNFDGGHGGGISNGGGADLEIVESRIQNNSATFGGGVNNNVGVLTVRKSLIGSNTAIAAGGICSACSSSGQSGGIVNLVNSTLSGNVATNGGGAIINSIFNQFNIINSTIARNSAGNFGGILNTTNGGVMRARNSIFSDNFTTAGTQTDFQGTLISEGHNLIRSTIGLTVTGTTTGNILGQDPGIDPVLRDNGGPTMTHALRVDSIAIDRGNNCVMQTPPSGGCLDPVLSTDQRLNQRPQDGSSCQKLWKWIYASSFLAIFRAGF